MKGSPILATILACLIMLGMYIGMRVALTSGSPHPPSSEISPASSPASTDQVSVYAEIYFSARPKNFTLTHPSTGQTILEIKDLDSSEWSGEIEIPVKNLTKAEIEILCTTTSSTPQDGYQFMQVILSPSDQDPQSQTLRAEGDITDVITFHWKEEQ